MKVTWSSYMAGCLGTQTVKADKKLHLSAYEGALLGGQRSSSIDRPAQCPPSIHLSGSTAFGVQMGGEGGH
jgi:hypothetical protein